MDLNEPRTLRNLSTRFLELIDHDKGNMQDKIYAVSDALIDLARKIEHEDENK